MDSSQHCLDHSAECESAQSEAETLALKFISRSWLGLAGQIDRYNELVRKRRAIVKK
jgi:hypothetical protein